MGILAAVVLLQQKCLTNETLAHKQLAYNSHIACRTRGRQTPSTPLLAPLLPIASRQAAEFSGPISQLAFINCFIRPSCLPPVYECLEATVPSTIHDPSTFVKSWRSARPLQEENRRRTGEQENRRTGGRPDQTRDLRERYVLAFSSSPLHRRFPYRSAQSTVSSTCSRWPSIQTTPSINPLIIHLPFSPKGRNPRQSTRTALPASSRLCSRHNAMLTPP